ncbi:hypothetical protein EAG_08569 [Camponotus floridanus]|uniref:Uncharacterized protein n=1 Tax=Camponotus floridanus TaxID=104421 RepID=E1ZWW6_CAMFO|nr:hypothetical protein EAG_08569 [Camponotus floridanus]
MSPSILMKTFHSCLPAPWRTTTRERGRTIPLTQIDTSYFSSHRRLNDARAGGRRTPEGRGRGKREILYFPDHKSTSWEKTLISCGVQGEDKGTSRLMTMKTRKLSISPFFTWVSRGFLSVVFPRLAMAYARLRKKTRGSYEMVEETKQTDLCTLPERCPD